MAGFFGFFDYTKPGPGVPKDAPPKARIVVFFEVFFRKFWNLIKLNMMFMVFNLPATVLAFAASFFVIGSLAPVDTVEESMIWGDLLYRFMISAVVLCIPVITVGPAQAGFTYVLRNYAREEHAFIWWDFKENVRKNLKQSLIVSAVDFVLLFMVSISLRFYTLNNGSNILFSVATGLTVLIFILFLMMHIYLYPMMVTFKLTVKQLYKNALLFSIMKFLPNLGILLVCVLILFLSLGFYPVIGLILYALITVSLIGFITNFYAYPKLQKYIIDKLEGEESEEEDSESEDPQDKGSGD